MAREKTVLRDRLEDLQRGRFVERMTSVEGDMGEYADILRAAEAGVCVLDPAKFSQEKVRDLRSIRYLSRDFEITYNGRYYLKNKRA